MILHLSTSLRAVPLVRTKGNRSYRIFGVSSCIAREMVSVSVFLAIAAPSNSVALSRWGDEPSTFPASGVVKGASTTSLPLENLHNHSIRLEHLEVPATPEIMIFEMLYIGFIASAAESPAPLDTAGVWL